MEFYTSNPEWEILENFATKHVESYGHATYPHLEFTLGLRRKSGHYYNTFIVPLGVLGILVSFIFLPPLGHTAKYILGF